MILMGIATTLVGLVPSYASIGIWGAVILTVLRSLQGIAVGGEWSGSVLMAGEWADPKRRGFTTSFAQMGAPLGLVLANGSLSLMTWLVGDEALIQWGWRLPFLASIVLVGIGLYVRMGVLESPVFARLKDLGKVAHAPVLLVIKENWREIALSTLLRTGQLVPYYVFTTYILSYGTRVLGLASATMLACLSLRSLTSIVMIPFAGHMSDLYGRKKIVAIGLVGIGLFSFVVLPDAGDEGGVAGVPGDGHRLGAAGSAVRATGGAHRRELPCLAALQRLRARVSPGLDHRRRSGADHRHVAVPAVPVAVTPSPRSSWSARSSAWRRCWSSRITPAIWITREFRGQMGVRWVSDTHLTPI